MTTNDRLTRRRFARPATWVGLSLVGVGSLATTSYPRETTLQHVPTVFGIVMLVWWSRRESNVSASAFAAAATFLALHLIGAHWIYSFVPYDRWFETLTGDGLSSRFDWQRNHYDRLVHAASGVCGMPVLSEWFQRCAGVSPQWAAGLAMMGVLGVGAVYEIVEWQIAITFSPAMAEAYNGQQGDVWDPQKDLAMAWMGAIVTWPIVAFRSREPVVRQQPSSSPIR